MSVLPWRVAQRFRYRRAMVTGSLEAADRPSIIVETDARWEAVQNGHVIARARELDELVYKLVRMGPAAQGAEARFVAATD